MSGILIDANLLCLLVAGALGPTAITDHCRLRAFDIEDYGNLLAILDRVGEPILCPHVLAETSNLIAYRQAPKQLSRLRRSLAHIVGQCAERSIDARNAVTDTHFERLGLTDAVLLLLARNVKSLLLSDDLHLCQEAGRRGLRVVNYSYVRDGALRIDQII